MTRIAVIDNAPAVRPIGQHPSVAPAIEDPDGAAPDASELGVVAQAATVCAVLETLGYDAPAFAASELSALTAFLVRERPDAVFNFCEALRGRADLEMCVAGLFELLGVPYTGSPPLTLGLCLNKGLTKAVLQAHGIATAGHRVVESAAGLDAPTSLPWPVIVKPLAEDASIGIDAGAVVYDTAALRTRVEFLTRALGAPVIVEEFIDGRAFMVALLATSAREWTTLPIEEVDFIDDPAGRPRILTHAAKWLPESEDYRTSPVAWPDLVPDLADRLRRAAIGAADAVGLRDYGRVDLRMRADGAIVVLEVNPNPELGAFVATARQAGLSCEDIVATIARRALERPPPYVVSSFSRTAVLTRSSMVRLAPDATGVGRYTRFRSSRSARARARSSTLLRSSSA